MKNKLTLLLVLTLVLSLVFAFTSCGGNNDTDTNTETETISESDTSTVTDTEVESDTETETESDTETETEVESDSNTETESDTDTETETEVESDTDTDTETDTDTDTDTETDEPEHVHAEEIIPAVEPTCTETGLSEGKKCSVCGEVLVAQETIDALDHDYITNAAKAPTCTEIGWSEYQTCSRCDYSTYEPTPANGHSYDGGYTCLDCGNTIASSEGLAYKLSDDGTYAIVTGIGDCWDKAIYIPTEYRGFPVKEIATDAFKGKTYITEIYIPNTVTTIQAESFSGCTALKKITLSKNITTITERAFYNCSSLKDLEIPNGITTIEKEAFNGCSAIETLTLAKPVCSIGDAAFDNCTALKDIMYSSTLEDWCSINFGNNALCFSDKLYINDKEIIGDVVLPNTVTKIPAYTFQNCSQITSITIPDTVTSVGNFAFSGCTGITNIEITKNVTEIGDSAFSGCINLKKVTVSKNLSKIGENVFNGCLDIETAVIPTIAIPLIPKNSLKSVTVNGGTNIPNEAFLDCATLTSVTILDSVTSIGNSAFSGCIGLTNLDIPNNVNSIGNSALLNCSSLETLTIPFVGGSATATISSSSTKFEYIFGNIPASLKCVTITGGNILDNAFYGCSTLETIIAEAVKSVGEKAFANCSSLKTLSIGNEVTTLPSAVFYGCSSLEDLTIPFVGASKNVAEYSSSALFGYIFGTSGYTNGVLTEQYFTSSYCQKYYIPSTLKNVTVTGGSILYGAFYNCSHLKSITIKDNVTSIRPYAFYNCTALEEINFNAIAVDDLIEYNSVFFNAGKYGDGIKVTIGKEATKIPAYLFYPKSSSSSSSTFSSKLISVTFEEGSACESIGSCAFYNCTSLTSIEIPDSVTSIGNSAFWGCTSLTSIETPNSVTSIGRYTFDNCSKLNYNEYDNAYYLGNLDNPYVVLIEAKDTSITSCIINENIKVIYQYAFYNCTSLESITIPDGVTSIGERTFYNCTSLTSLTIGEGVTNIGDYAFLGCKALTEINFNAKAMNDLSKDNYVFYNAGKNGDGTKVTIGKEVTKIPAYLFYPYSSDSSYSPKITSIVFEEGSVCKSIGEYAFYNCTKLTEINFNAIAMNSLGLGNFVFYNAGINGEGIKVTIGKEVTKIPAYLFYPYYDSSYSPKITSVLFEEGSVCESIGVCAFYKCTNLTSILIPDSVTSIGSSAFSDCTGLTSITIPDSVTSIGNDAFYGCTSLTSVIIGDSVTSIGNDAFYGCASLTSVIIGDSVTSIGNSAFSGCTALTEINFNAIAMNDLSENNVVFSNVGTNGDGINVTIGKEVTKIPVYLFCPYRNDSSYSPKITSVLFEEGSVCESIGECAFYKCTNLTSILIPDSVTSIGGAAFAYSTSLTNVTIGNSVTSIGYSAFWDCTRLTSIEIPDSITSIGSDAFYNCSKLNYNEYNNAYYLGNEDNPYVVLMKAKDKSITSCTINENTKFVYQSAFYGCTSLTSVTIPSSVTSIGKYAFYNCTSLENIYFNAIAMNDLDWGNYVFYNAGKNEDGIKVTIGKDVTKIPAYLFCPDKDDDLSDSPNITGVEFEEGSVCESIKLGAFRNCTSLESITIPDGVTSIGERTFYNCTSLTSITIPDSVTSIGSSAFYDCTSLTSVTIGKGVTNIGDSAFYNCSSLTYNEYDNAYYLGNNDNPYLVLVKAKDKSITSCAINENTKFIHSDAFYYCTSLTSITISEKVTSIGGYAFYNCNSLTSVNYLGTIEQWCNIEFGDYYANPVYYARNLYINGELLTELVIPKTVTEIKDYAFLDCTSLESITIPDGVTSIGERTFYNCTGLTSVTIGDSVTSIGSYAFYGCTGLTSVTFEDANGWYVTVTQEGITSGADVDLTNASTNATYLTDTYDNYYWYKK